MKTKATNLRKKKTAKQLTSNHLTVFFMLKSATKVADYF
jgi:hypothetical protein